MPVKVNQLMRRGLIFVDASTPIRDAAKVMTNDKVGLLVVTNGGKMIGVVSERDIMRAVADGVNLSEPVERITTRNVVTINPDSTLYEAAELMHRFNIRHLVVVDEVGNPIGVLSVRDVVAEPVRLRILAEHSSVSSVEEQPIPHTD
ncbi:CBS domain-containing protein [Caldivirga sp.]|uniref:CBS domain-containing protein n=1 Tax=Caldivirga sp. TaxID=2080243 RepID=UPI0025BB0640|nr:CBS domain-containing protein [Caldivirga sp.]